MKTWLYRFIFFTATFFIHHFAIAAKYALVIGNDIYAGNIPRLYNPSKDANKISAALNQIGFSVTLKTDLNKKSFDSEVIKFTEKLSNNDIAFIYFAGHGVAYNGVDYLLPSHTDISVADNLQYDAINAQAMLNRITSTNAHTILVLDACRNNPFVMRNIVKRGLHFMVNRGSSYIFYSAGYGEEASDDGTFAQVLAEELLRPQTLESLRVNVSRVIKERSNGAQIPNALTQLDIEGGELYLHSPSAPIEPINLPTLTLETMPQITPVEMDSTIKVNHFSQSPEPIFIAQNTPPQSIAAPLFTAQNHSYQEKTFFQIIENYYRDFYFADYQDYFVIFAALLFLAGLLLFILHSRKKSKAYLIPDSNQARPSQANFILDHNNNDNNDNKNDAT